MRIYCSLFVIVDIVLHNIYYQVCIYISIAFTCNVTNKFIDDLCSINDGRDFSNSFVDISPAEIYLKLEHQGARATFLDLDITIKDDILYINYSTKEITLLFSFSECQFV